MKKNYFTNCSRITFSIVFLFFIHSISIAQVAKAFAPRYNEKIKGDMTLIANNIVNRNYIYGPNTAYDAPYTSLEGHYANDNFEMRYIDIDSDPDTFSSSSAKLEMPAGSCYKMVYAGLYWSATNKYNIGYSNSSSDPGDGFHHTDFNKVKLKLPGNTSYINLTGEVIFEGYTSSNANFNASSPYACYADITTYVKNLANPEGEYTVANIRATQGYIRAGVSGGWTIFFVYEDPSLPGKYITSFDGFAGVFGVNETDIDFTGFTTIPSGVVKAKLASSSLEGDRSIANDQLLFKGGSSSSFTPLSGTYRTSTNFFNSRITILDTEYLNRTPKSRNTLGYDADIMKIDNLLANNENSATLKLKSTQDQYYMFFGAFNVEIIEPKIILGKKVQNANEIDLNNANVSPNDELFYVLSFQNQGNDDATSFTIRDVLPANVTFVPGDIILPNGVTYTYNPVTHEIVFTVNPNLVKIGSVITSIKIKVKVSDCHNLRDACSNIIKNRAYSSYKGVINGTQITDDPSFSGFNACNIGEDSPTNFLVGLGACSFDRNVELCGANVTLTAASGYASYLWTNAAGTTIGTTQSITVTNPGVYHVVCTGNAPCMSITENITVTPFASNLANPLAAPFADEVVTCLNDGDQLVKVFLCGATDTRTVNTNITDAISIKWEKLDESSCAAVGMANCANKNPACTWVEIAQGPNFTATDEGKYRMVINYQNGCFRRFYFDVTKNVLLADVVTTDVICDTTGSITVTNVPSTGYEFSLSPTGPWSLTNIFPNLAAGTYTVYIRQTDINNPKKCVFTVPGILIRNHVPTINIIPKNPLCKDDKGSIRVQVNDALPQYLFELYQGTTLIQSSVWLNGVGDNDYTFTDQNAGSYTIKVTTTDGCILTGPAVLINPTEVEATANVIRPITCVDGQIRVNAIGGTAPYTYIVNGGGILLDPVIEVSTPGVYTIIVKDANNCSTTTQVTVGTRVQPTFSFGTVYETCEVGANNGAIIFQSGNNYGYTIQYSIDNGVTYQTSLSFTNLASGTYHIKIKYVVGTTTDDAGNTIDIVCESYTVDTVVQAASQISGSAVLLQDYTCLQKASIQAQNVSGGTLPYKYAIDGINFQAGNTFINLTNGTYTITIRDADNCTFVTNAIVVENLNPPTNITFVASQVTCPTLITDVTVTVVGGTAPFIYEITAPTTLNNGNNNVFTGLYANSSYTIKVTDSKGCTFSNNYLTPMIKPVVLTTATATNVTCKSTATGSITFNTHNYSNGATYDYTINGGTAVTGQAPGTAITIPNLSVGIYVIVVKDPITQCTDTKTVTITEPTTALNVILTPTAITCVTPGKITVDATGGWGGFIYQLTYPNGTTIVGPQLGSVFNNLTAAGQYTVTVVDDGGCTVTNTVTLNSNATIPILAINSTSDLCFDPINKATLVVDITNPAAGEIYTYSINGGTPQPSNTFTDLTPGSYTITVVGTLYGCSATITKTIEPSLAIAVTAANISACTTSTSLGITVTGGNGVYQYAVQTNSTGAINYTSTIPTAISTVGTHIIWVKDGIGCTASFPITIVKDAPIVITATGTNVSCYGTNSGVINISATGGSSIYEYSINNGATFGTITNFVNVLPGTYTIVVKDNRGCSATTSVIITQPQHALTASAGVSKDITCDAVNNLAEVRITNALGGVGPYTYSFNGVTYGPSNIGHLPVGTHTVYIRDTTGCTFPMTVIVTAAPAAPVITTDIVPNCDGTSNITVTTSNTTFDYTYAIDGVPVPAQTNNVFTNVPAGPHVITTNYSSNIPPSPSDLLQEDFGAGPNTSINNIDPVYCYEPQDGTGTCGTGLLIDDGEYCVTKNISPRQDGWAAFSDHTGNTNGRMLVLNVGGVAGLQGVIYKKPIIDIIPNQNIITSIWGRNLVKSTYNIGEPDILIQLVDNTGAVIAQQNTGSIPNNEIWNNYIINLNPGSNTQLNLVIRTNSTVTNGNDLAIDDIHVYQLPEVCGSVVTTPIVVVDKTFKAQIVGSQNIKCNGANDGQVTIQAENFGPYFYSLNNGTTWTALTGTSPFTITGLAPGVINIKVKGTNADTCIKDLTITLTEPAPLTIDLATTPKTCLVNGEVTVTAGGGSGNYTYQLTHPNGTTIVGPQGNNVFTGLTTPGTYTVVIKDINGCTATDTFAIVNPTAIVATINSTSDICYDGDKASIIVDVTGGVAPYSYSLNGGLPQTSNTFLDLTSGSYTITVKDDFGCTTTVSQVIAPQITANAVLTKALDCTTTIPTAEIKVTIGGGVPAYTYQVSFNGGTYGTPATVTGTTFVYPTTVAGTYRFQVKDSKGCIVLTNIVTILPITSPVITSVVQGQSILCHGEATGSITVNINTAVGVAPFVINVTNTTTGVNYVTQTSGLTAGVYEVTITDANSCKDVKSITINEPSAITYDIVPENIICDATGASTIKGKIHVNNVMGGTPLYTYYLHNSLGVLVNQFGPIANTTHVFDILEYGFYQIDVVDANGCLLRTENIKIASPPNSLDIVITPVSTNCATGGTVSVTVEGSLLGSGPFYFALYTTPIPVFDPASIPPFIPADPGTPLTATFSNLTPGVIYSFVVYDDTTKCYYFQQAPAPIPTNSTLTSTVKPNNVTCTGNADGSVSFTFSNYDATATSVSYQIYSALNNSPVGVVGTTTLLTGPTIIVNNFGTLAPGNYYILFTENGGSHADCTSGTAHFTISQSVQTVEVTASATKNDNCKTNAGQITATGQFGTTPYQYQIVPTGSPAPTVATWTGSTINVFNVEGGDYTVYIKDANNCIQSATSVLLPTDPTPAITAVVTNQCTSTNGNFTISVNLVSVGVGPYTYSLDGGAFQTDAATTFTYTNLSSGAHSVELKDSNGCGNKVSLVIYPVLNIAPAAAVHPTCVNNDGKITVTAVGGSGVTNFQYSLLNSAGTVIVPSGSSNIFTGLAGGTYTVIVKDNLTTCSTTLAVILEIPTPVTFTTTTEPVSCFGGNDGSITVVLDTTANDDPVYLYSINGGTPQNNPVFNGLTAGDYIIKVISGKNCSLTQTITVGGPNKIIIDPSAITVVGFGCTTGNNVNNATITVNPLNITGGTGTYLIYQFIDNATSNVVQQGNNPIYIFTNTTGGSFTINVFDQNGCVGTSTATVLPYNELQSATAVVDTPITCINGGETIHIDVVSTISNPADLEYSQDNGAIWQDSNVFSNLAIGTHAFVIRNKVTGCIIYATHLVKDPNTFIINVTKINDVICFGTTSGAVTFGITDATYTGPFTWEIFNISGVTTGIVGIQNNNGPTPAINLGAGDYYVEIKLGNAPSCTKKEFFSIAAPTDGAITVQTQVTPITCVGNDGSITITATGGWGNYTYYVGVNAPAAGDYTTNAVWSGLAPNTYQVWVKDVNGCEAQATNVVLNDPTPISGTLQITQQNCIGLQGQIEVLNTAGGQGSNYSYQLVLNGTPVGIPQISPIFSNLGVGTYQVIITDQWTCSITLGPVTLYNEITPSIAVIKPIGCEAINPGGEITISIIGGSPTINYTVVFPDGTTTQTNTTGVFTNLIQPGVYTFTILDTTTNCSFTVTQGLDAPTAVTFSTVTTMVSCFGGDDGTILVELGATNNNPEYLYSIDGGLGQTNPLFTGLVAGTYQVTATSVRGCSLTQPVTITEPTKLLITAMATDFVCSATNVPSLSTITITGQDGTGTYTYSINGTNYVTTNTFEVPDTGVVQTINVYVKDAKGCIETTAVTLNPMAVITAVAVNQITAITCNNPEAVEVVVTGGSGDFTYQLLPSGTPQVNNNQFTLLAVGTYAFQVTDNVTGCYTITTPYVVAPYDLIAATATATIPVTCFGGTDGAMEINVTGYTGAYTYDVMNTANISVANGTGNTTVDPTTITDIPAGNYTVVVTATDTPYCSITTNTVTVASPAVALAVTLVQNTSVTCDNNQGEVIATAEGGWGNYLYEFINTTTGLTIQGYATNHVFSGLAAGTYQINVKDDKLCIASQTIILALPTPITITSVASTTTLLCYDDETATITAQATGGSGANYQYTLHYGNGLTSGPQTSPVFNNLGAGTYYVTVKDNWNCEATAATITINEPTEIVGTLSQTVGLTCTADATLTITATGGTPPYQYSTDNMTFSQNNTFSVGVGTYQYYVKDVNGCSVATNQVIISPVPALQIALDLSGAIVNCAGNNNAVIVATATGGLGNYSYILLNASNAVVAGPQASGIFTGLVSGQYIVKVDSGDCTQNSTTITITEPVALVAVPVISNIKCNGETNGSIKINATGGTGTIMYAISPNLNQWQTSNVFNNLEVGTYDIVVQDQNGCYIPLQVTITEPAVLDANLVVMSQELCAGTNTGSIKIVPTGGTAPYYTSLNSSLPGSFVQGQLLINNLSGGQTYTVYIKDANGCMISRQVTLTAPVTINATYAITYSCNNNTPGNEVTITVNADVAANVTYAMDNGAYQASNVFNNLSNGNHTVSIKHTNGCIKTLTFHVNNKPAIKANADVVNVICGNDTTGKIMITVMNPVGVYQYSISPNLDQWQTSSVFTNLAVGTYTVNVKNEIGCMISLQVIVSGPSPIVGTVANVIPEVCLGDQDASIQISITGGVGPYSTSLNTPNNFIAGQVLFEDLTGNQTYTIYIKDSKGCQTFIEVLVAKAIDIRPTAVVTYACQNNGATNTVTINVNPEAVDDVMYALNGGQPQLENTFTNLAPGSYTVEVSHISGCVKTVSFVIVNVPTLTLTATATGLNQIVAIAGGGTPAYHYYFNNHDNGNSNTYTITQTGTYIVKVVDANGCEVEVPIFVKFVDILIPNFFTPDGDGFNDGWSPLHTEGFPNIITTVYDRYGREIAHLRQGEKWDGKYNGTELPSGDYWYVVKLNSPTDDREFVGNFTLYR
ncbi:T9SS type B sorting domain-containing protein [Flavobacterium sp. '19STA2R22 D10 B1']|uniref:T9SS type B sorting domain-containing protein n=1 Tax=Flavobacterium aerium TaxID=3037261 RepID=UPI00278C4FDF|nr:T9SS type B sorting domain-containing protein [Flavobacterium sp. '19STA2R22 D10 B1']